jgi:hypothetical protein
MNIKDIFKFLSPKYQSLFLEYKIKFKPRYGNITPPHKLLYEIIDNNRAEYRQQLTESLKHKDIFHQIKRAGEETNPCNPAYNNGYLPGLDIIGLYTIITKYKPQIYIEVGSGNSTKVTFKAIKDNGLNTRIISIDPAPRAEIDQLANTIIRKPFEDIDFSFIFDLQENDILFIDNSHRILPNSDSMVFYLEVLPKIQKGVIVHIHDIYLPYDYPQFMCDRFYSEQYGLAMYLLADKKRYHPLLPNFFISEDIELRSILEPVWNHPNLEGVERHGGSFWFVIC